MSDHESSHPSLNCPKCGQRTIVKFSKTEYRCISCDFKRDFEKEEKDKKKDKKKDGPGMDFVFFLIGGVLLLLML